MIGREGDFWKTSLRFRENVMMLEFFSYDKGKICPVLRKNTFFLKIIFVFVFLSI